MVRWIRRRPRRASQRTGCSSTTPSKGFPWCCSMFMQMFMICKNPLLVWSVSSDKIAHFNVLLQISDFSQCLGFVWNHAIAEYVICCVAMVALCLFLKSNENCPQKSNKRNNNLTCVFFPNNWNLSFWNLPIKGFESCFSSRDFKNWTFLFFFQIWGPYPKGQAVDIELIREKVASQ